MQLAECTAKNRPQEISLTARMAELLAWVCIMVNFFFFFKLKITKVVRSQGEKQMLQKKPKPQMASFLEESSMNSTIINNFFHFI